MIELLLKLWIPLIITLFNMGVLIIVKFNDMKHIQCDIKKIWEEVVKIRDETAKQGERLARLEERTNGGR